MLYFKLNGISIITNDNLVQASLEKERSTLAERKSALEKLQAEHTMLLEQNGTLKTEVETLQFKLQQSSQGVPVEQAPADTGMSSPDCWFS
jgi:cell division protein FtsB